METTKTEDTQRNQSSEAPPRFTWCVGGLLSACGFPATEGHLRYLAENNVTSIVSLTEERKVDKHGVDINVVDIPVKDYTAPTVEQVNQFVQLVNESEKEKKGVAVHCAGGRGRTGVMLACYFIREHGMTAGKAVEHIRALRPGSIESVEQELFVYKFAEAWKEGQDAEKKQIIEES